VSHARKPARRRTYSVEALETRDLPTVMPLHTIPRVHAQPLVFPSAQVGVTNVPQGITGTPTAPAPDANGGLPTSHEVARQRYVGKFKGDYVIGPGRYTDQAAALSSLGYGGSNQAFHLWSNMRLTAPTSPDAPVTGQIYMIPWSVATTGTSLVLDLKGVAGTAVNGFPTSFTWTVDPSSGGLYSNSTGEGTLNINYFRPGHGPKPGTLHGQLQFSINGFVNVVGIFNVTGVLGNLPNGKR
jgi:hypothetical protein